MDKGAYRTMEPQKIIHEHTGLLKVVSVLSVFTLLALLGYSIKNCNDRIDKKVDQCVESVTMLNSEQTSWNCPNGAKVEMKDGVVFCRCSTKSQK